MERTSNKRDRKIIKINLNYGFDLDLAFPRGDQSLNKDPNA
jgi:hypothetical protein